MSSVCLFGGSARFANIVPFPSAWIPYPRNTRHEVSPAAGAGSFVSGRNLEVLPTLAELAAPAPTPAS